MASSDHEDSISAECTIEVKQEPLVKVVNQEQKLVRQPPLHFGPLEFNAGTEWGDFLQSLAEACLASKSSLNVQFCVGNRSSQ